MKYHEICKCCNHQATAYTLKLNESLASAFIKFAEKFLEDREGINKGDIGLTNPQYSNFQNLRYFGIIEQKEKGRKWYLTDLGEKFYYGETFVKSPIAFMNGVVLPSDHKCWETTDEKIELVSLRERLPEHYKKRPEYQEEKSRW